LADKDAVVVGAGPNGLAAAITLARAGKSVLLLERDKAVGGATQSAELTLPGFVHDRCSTVHAMANVSPFFRELSLQEFGLEYVHPDAPFAHPLDDGTAGICERSLDATCEGLGIDADAYRKLIGPAVRDWDMLVPALLGPPKPPRHPIAVGRFGLVAIRSASTVARSYFATERARLLFAGAAAHSIIPLDWLGSAAYGLVLMAAAHVVGWPVAQGGSQRLADALAACFEKLGGEIQTGIEVKNVDDLPRSATILCDLTPRQMVAIAGHRLNRGYVKKLRRFKYGPGVFKLDWALSGPIPWKAAECARAGTVHLGGGLEEIEASEAACWRGDHVDKPFVLLVQPTLFDPTRAPTGKHIAWAYCHVPNGSTVDMTDRIERQIERFAPGFKDLILARSILNSADMERHNPNLVGGDICGGGLMLSQVIFRPVLFPSPYMTSMKNLYICSASTPPGGGVHGMGGYNAAKLAMWRHQMSK
jgi:phytoene dehydrogenase-like protein